VIRTAVADDVTALVDVELASGALFLDVGMPDIAEGEPMWIAHWDRFHEPGLAWVLEADGRVVGFALAELLDGALHLEQLSVLPEYGRRGFGSALVEHVCAVAGDRGLPAVTLSTFRDVPFNGPFYARLGFAALDESKLTPGLRACRDSETANGLDPTTRVMMRRPVS
jgi:GNAT superfamily N-acetyltransferase